MAATRQAPSSSRGTAATINATIATVMIVLPVFFFGALIVLIREDIPISDSRLGLSISAYFLVSAVASVPGGRFADVIGPRTGMTIGITCSSLSLLGIGVVATSWQHIAGLLAVAGLGSAIGMASSNLALAQLVPHQRRGFAFGIKQAAAPTASVISGFAVPLVGLTIGWRWAFVIAPLSLFAAFLLTAQSGRRVGGLAEPIDPRTAPLLPLVLLAVTAGLAAAAATVTIGFFVESAVERGFATGTAGFVLGVASAFGIGARVLWGWLADRRERGHLTFLAILFLVGSTGFALLGIVDTVPLLTLAAVIVLVSGWSWSGLMFLVATLGSPGAPATATGITSAGAAVGGLVGPIAFGFIIERGSYTVAWLVTASWMIAAAAFAQVTLVTWRRVLARRDAVRQPVDTATPQRPSSGTEHIERAE